MYYIVQTRSEGSAHFCGPIKDKVYICKSKTIARKLSNKIIAFWAEQFGQLPWHEHISIYKVGRDTSEVDVKELEIEDVVRFREESTSDTVK